MRLSCVRCGKRTATFAAAVGVPFVAAAVHLAVRLHSRYTKQAILPLALWRPFVLQERSIISGPGADPPTIRLRFGWPTGFPGLADQLDLGKGDHVKVNWGGNKPKSYSPLAGGLGGSDPSNQTFDLVVKVYNRSGASSYLGDVAVGDAVKMSGPFPPMREMKAHNGGGSSVGIVCFGVGITEGIAVAAAELRREEMEGVTLLWAHRYAKDAALSTEVDDLQRLHPTRLVVRRVYSRETAEVPADYRGRVSADVLRDAFGLDREPRRGARFLVVGTKETIKEMWGTFASLGWTREQHELLQKAKLLGMLRGLLRVLTASAS